MEVSSIEWDFWVKVIEIFCGTLGNELIGNVFMVKFNSFIDENEGNHVIFMEFDGNVLVCDKVVDVSL